MMTRLHVASVKGGHPLVARIAARACQLQGMPEVHYPARGAQWREAAERGTYNILAALESLGIMVMVPDELSPTLPHEREEPTP